MDSNENLRIDTFVTSGIILIGITSLTKIAAFFKEILIASQFGVSEITDAYFIAFTIPNVFLFLLGIDLIKGTSTSIFSAYLAHGKKEEFWQVFSSIFNLTFLFAFSIIVLGIWQMPLIISWLAPTFVESQLTTSITLGRILLTLILTMGLTNYLVATLNALKRFVVPALSVFFANLIVVLFLIVYSKKIGIYSVAWGYFGGFVLSLVVLFVYLQLRGVKYRFKLISNFQEVSAFIKKSAPLLLLTTSSQINLLVERSIASRLDTGGVSALNFAHKINHIPVEICIVPLLTVLLPTLSREYANGQFNELKERLRKSIHIICLLLIPITIGVILFRNELVHIVFQRGAFDSSDTVKTSSALLFYAIGILPHGLYLFFIYNYLAFQKTLTLGKIGTLVSLTNIALNLILVHYFEYIGIAMAWTISAFIYFCILAIVFKKKLISSSFKFNFLPIIKIFISGALMGSSLYFMKTHTSIFALNQVLSLLLAAASGLLIYIIFLFILNESETRILIHSIWTKFIKRK